MRFTFLKLKISFFGYVFLRFLAYSKKYFIVFRPSLLVSFGWGLNTRDRFLFSRWSDPDQVILNSDPDQVILNPDPDPVILNPDPDPVILNSDPDQVILNPYPQFWLWVEIPLSEILNSE